MFLPLRTGVAVLILVFAFYLLWFLKSFLKLLNSNFWHVMNEPEELLRYRHTFFVSLP